MLKLILHAVVLMAFAGAALAADKPTGQTIELKDGGRLTVDKDGTMAPIDAAGRRARDGIAMEGKDGSKYMMKNDAIWRQITEKGTMNPNR